MNVYVPSVNLSNPETLEAQRLANDNILQILESCAGVEIMRAPPRRLEDLSWLDAANLMVAEATQFDGQARRESMYVARTLGRDVLLTCIDTEHRDQLKADMEQRYGRFGESDPWIISDTYTDGIFCATAIRTVIDHYKAMQEPATE